jgi:hypothetical protein
MSARPFLILMVGTPESGKTLAVAVLMKLLRHHGVRLTSFAEAVEKDASAKYNFPYELVRSSAGRDSIVYTEDGPKSVRELINLQGKYMSATFGDNIFAQRVVDKILIEGPTAPWIIHDWTLVEDASYLKYHLDPSHLISVRIRAPVANTSMTYTYYGDGLNTSHTIMNSGSIEDLEHQISAMLRNYFPDVRV